MQVIETEKVLIIFEFLLYGLDNESKDNFKKSVKTVLNQQSFDIPNKADSLVETNPANAIDKIVADIRRNENISLAMAFSQSVVKLLKDNGIDVLINENATVKTGDDENTKYIKELYRVGLERLDTTAHDRKVINDFSARMFETVNAKMDAQDRPAIPNYIWNLSKKSITGEFNERCFG